MRASFLAPALLAALSVAACSVLSGEDAETQEAAHTEGDPTFAQHSFLWANESEVEFKKNAVDNGSDWMGPADFLPLDHPMTQRLQYWIDRMDDLLRTAHPEALSATPRPKLIIRKSETANAWVSALPVRWTMKTRLLGAVDAGPAPIADAGTDGDADASAPPPVPVAPSLMLRRSGTIEKGPSTSFDRDFTRDQAQSFEHFFNENFTRCRLDYQGAELTFSEQCLAKSGQFREGNALSYYATAKYVTFTTGYILQLLDEDRVISTLAHELGHYYRSHTNVPTDVVNYFYSLDTVEARKPAPDARYIEQTANARKKLREGTSDWREENALMRDNHLGFYTTEQEADEIALELISKLGVPPSVAVDKVLVMLKNNDVRSGDAIGWTECSTLRESGWKDRDGKDVSVPVGDPSNAHHSLCFRVFNMTREIAAHRYAIGSRAAPPGDAWSSLVSRMGVEIHPPPTPASDAGAPADSGTD